MKKIINLAFVLVLLVSCKQEVANLEYGVFIGLNDPSNIKGYDLIIIDADHLEKEKIDRLKQNNNQVYSYLSIGTLEEYRDCFDEFKQYSFEVYDDWPDEYWMDVSKKEWQDYLISKSEEYKEKGIDGLFLDNTDVYGVHTNEEIYDGLVDIFSKINKLDLKIMVNGGDVFVRKAVEAQDIKIDAINQETVFTAIDFENNTLGKREKEDGYYYKDYLNFARENGIEVYLLEYGSDEEIAKEIRDYCKRNGFKFFISKDINLDKK